MYHGNFGQQFRSDQELLEDALRRAYPPVTKENERFGDLLKRIKASLDRDDDRSGS